jgi:hypothetical protein
MVSYSAEDFVGALTSDEGLPPLTRPVMQTGLVDPAESSSEQLRFAPGILCSNLNWIKVPVGIIDAVTHLGNQRCGQHEYPYVQLRLKDSTELTDEGSAIIGILQSGATPGPTMSPTPTTVPAPTRQVTPPPPVPYTPSAGQYASPAGQYAAPTRRVTPPPVPPRTPPAGQYAAPTRGYTPSVSRHKDPTLPTIPVHLRGCG